MSFSLRLSQIAISFLLCLIAYAPPALAQNTAPNQWTWMGGNNGASRSSPVPSEHGSLGTFSPGNAPGGLYDAAGWTDRKGNLWLFGGLGYYQVQSGSACGPGGYPCSPTYTDYDSYSNELWEFNPSINEWAWMGGQFWANCSGTLCASPGVYGTLGVSATGNTPGGRSGAASWTDKSGNFWLFGGNGADVHGNLGYLNDLWKFDPSINGWTWMGGENHLGSTCGELGQATVCGQPGVYGTLGTPAPGNIPGSRSGASTWTDSSGNLWLFGGLSWDASGTFGSLNDLWIFNPSTNEWTWMSGGSEIGSNCATVNGATMCGLPGVYGTLGASAAGYVPAGRSFASSWTDGSGNFWLYGGWVFAFNFLSGSGSPPDNLDNAAEDFWMFNPSTNEWAWMGGNMSWYESGVYGTPGVPAAGNSPDLSFDSTAWTDSTGNFWLFESENSCSLWEFIPSTNEWAWMGGSNDVCGGESVWGVLGTPAAENFPGFRKGAAGWTDSSGNLWLFGGDFDGLGVFNDLWVYQPHPQAATPVFSVAPGNYSSAQMVTISDATPEALVYYTTDGTTPRSGSTQYVGAITVSATETVQAIAIAPDFLTSAVSSATYVINPPDFSVAASPASFTVTAGQSGTTSISVTPANGFNSAISFACSGLPAGASCTFSPATVTLSGSSASTTLTIATSATAALSRNQRSLLPIAAFALTFLWLSFPNRRSRRMFVLLAISAAGLSLLSACGGGGSGSGSAGGGGGSKPATSTITITASSGSLQHTATISLTVN